MGVTVQSSKSKLDMSYFGFARLRRDIAYMADIELGMQYEKGLHVHTPEEAECFVTEVAELMQAYTLVHGQRPGKIADFLFAEDCGGSVTYGCCQELLKVLTASDDREKQFAYTVYGYAGWGENAARGEDFIRLLRECVDAKKPLRWD